MADGFEAVQDAERGGAVLGRFVSEKAAKVAVYTLFTLVVLAVVFFWQTALSFKAAEVQPAPPAAAEGDGAVSAAVGAAEGKEAPEALTPIQPALDPKVEQGLQVHQEPKRLQPPGRVPSAAEEALPERAAPVALDAAVLKAEWQRLEAQFGIERPAALVEEYVGTYHATAYCCEAYPHICGGNGVTASGTVPLEGITCASDWSVLPPGTWIYIRDVGIRRIEDSGSAILGNRLDVAITTHQAALRWPGYGTHDVWVLAWGVK